ncbi:MAG: putative peptide zinc metalloprotease protein [Gammaproteobacteria bacterium]|jgi:putative peptide zinc metalloprotease protein
MAMSESMSTSDTSSWAQIAPLRPVLRDHLRIHAHRYRGEPWYVIEDAINNRHHRFDADAFRTIQLFDGERSVAAIVDELAAQPAHSPPKQSVIIDLLAHLHAAELLNSGLPPSTEALFKRYARLNRGRWQRGLMSPLAVRVPLLDPDAFLERTHRLVGWAYSRWMLPLWLLLIALSGLLAASESTALAHHWQTRALDPSNLALMWLIYPFMKALHELGHAYAVKHWGGSVHEIGVMLLVFTPVPYVDASAATIFASKHRRMAVGAAGIVVELLLSAAALLVWSSVETGLVRDVAFNIGVIGVTSTLLFNGNPLVRFDGYFVLADALESPNLGTRSSQYLAYLLQRYFLGLNDARAPACARGERQIFVIYGLSSLVYRTFILFSIALYVAGKMFFIGVVFALWVIAAQVVLPVVRQFNFVLRSPRLAKRRGHAVGATLLVLSAASAGLLLVPVPASTSAQGIIRFPPGAEVRAGTSGVVARLAVADGFPVSKGEPLVVLDDPFLHAELKRSRWRAVELDRLHSQARMKGPLQAQRVAAARDKARAELANVMARTERLIVRSPADGTVHIIRAADLPGRFVEQGELLAQLSVNAQPIARVVVPQRDAASLRMRTVTVQVRVAGAIEKILEAQVHREVPMATDRLPSKALGSSSGGAISVDSRDDDGTHALARVFELDLTLPGDAPDYRPGTRVHARFVHQPQPLASQLYRRLRQLFLAHFQV